MELNTRIKEILTECNIHHEDGISFLYLLYYNLKPSYIPDLLTYRMGTTGIYEMGSTSGLVWLVPLFKEQQTAFSWVKTEYRELFKDANSERAGNGNTATRLMKKLFAENPEVRKDEVIGATKMYIRNTNSDYIRMSHYFISKGAGASKTEDIKDWIDKYRLAIKSTPGRVSRTNTMQ